MMKVLVSGGAGFIGRRLCAALLESGDEVAALDSLHPQVHPSRQVPHDFPEAVQLIQGDVCSTEVWAHLLATFQPDTIVHLAAETGTGQSLTEPTRHAVVNVVGTAAMLEAVERAVQRPSHIILASSRAVYGEGAWVDDAGDTFYPGPRSAAQLEAGQWDHRSRSGGAARAAASVAGRTVPDPASIYAASKLAQEHFLKSWATARGVSYSILRLQNVYGPGQSVTNSYTGVLTLFARTALEGGVIDVYEDGEIVRDFVFVDDVVAALVSAVRRPSTRLVDVGSGQPVTIRAVAESVAAACGAPAPIVSGRFRYGDVRAAWCTTDLATESLEYVPRTTLSTGIGALLEWIAATTRSSG